MRQLIETFLASNPFAELALICSVLVLFASLSWSLKQPILIGYIVAGILLSPQVFDIISHQESIETYAHIGVSFLLFTVGLGLNPAMIRDVGKISALAGVGQVIFTSIIGFLLAYVVGFDAIMSLFLAIALTFSSTIVIVKLISDRGERNTTYGKVALGILIVQDVIAMLLLIGLSSIQMLSEGGNILFLGATVIAKILGLLLIIGLIAKYCLPKIVEYVSHNREILLLTVISRALIVGVIWYFAGFSMEIGALIAGVCLASSDLKHHIEHELRPLRDFFTALFFVYLGSQIIFDGLGQSLLPIIILSVFVLIGNPLIIMAIMKRFDYPLKDSFMTGLTVAQISEFSFIVIALALSTQIIQDPAILSMVTIIGLITMTGSSYMFYYADGLYDRLLPFLELFQGGRKKESKQRTTHYKFIIIGYNRITKQLVPKLVKSRHKYIVLENNPERFQEGIDNNVSIRFADGSEFEHLNQLIEKRTKAVCITTNLPHVNSLILKNVQQIHPQCKVLCLANDQQEATTLQQQGAKKIVVPHTLSADKMREELQGI